MLLVVLFLSGVGGEMLPQNILDGRLIHSHCCENLKSCFEADFLLGLFINPEDSNSFFLRNMPFNGLYEVVF
jgi:hypothetical protein